MQPWQAFCIYVRGSASDNRFAGVGSLRASVILDCENFFSRDHYRADLAGCYWSVQWGPTKRTYFARAR